ncbi:MAG: hypothetical protein ACK5HL_02215 [Bacilli bacterium]
MNDAIDVLKLLNDKINKSYIVGGFVRDYLLKRGSPDIDIATSMPYEKVIVVLKDYIVNTNKNYFNVNIKYNNIPMQVTSFRIEHDYLDFRRPSKISYTSSFIEDLQRRDFTINTFAIDENGNVLDLLNGSYDLSCRLIKTVGSADIKIKEDALRILRAIRFCIILDFKLDEELKIAIMKYRENIKYLSKQVIKKEIDILFGHKFVLKSLEIFKEFDLISILEIKNTSKFNPTFDILGNYMQLVNIDSYPFTKQELKIIRKLNALTNSNLKNPINLFNHSFFQIKIACQIKNEDFDKIKNIYKNMEIKYYKDLEITTDEIIKLTLSNYKLVKSIKEDIIQKILIGDIKNDKRSIKHYLIS